MAMAHGKSGSVAFAGGGSYAEVVSWSIDATADVAETTAMDATLTYKTYLAGWNDWTANVECKWSATGLAALGALAALTLTLVNAGATIVGNGICTGYGVSTDAQDVITQTYTFQGTGGLNL